MARPGSNLAGEDFDARLQKLRVARDEALTDLGTCVERQAYAEQQTAQARTRLNEVTHELVYHSTQDRPATFIETQKDEDPVHR